VTATSRFAHHDLCFGCGIANVFGLQFEAEAPVDGELRGRFFVKQDLMGPPGVMHGGLVATALDEVMSLLVFAENPRAPTARIETDLRAPIPLGTFVHASSRVVERDGRKVIAAAELRDDDGALLAEGRGVFVVPASG
jgi:acyl-coenzyme A thioesterase PaaI-like protein